MTICDDVGVGNELSGLMSIITEKDDALTSTLTLLIIDSPFFSEYSSSVDTMSTSSSGWYLVKMHGFLLNFALSMPSLIRLKKTRMWHA